MTGYKQVADRLSVQYICAGEYATSMQNIPLPVSWPKDPSLQTKYMTRAYREIRKEVLFHFFEDKWWLRLSVHAYSTQEDVDGLGEYILSIAKE
jgi:selenocysteine lyase/cysteine desulfurase